MQNRPEIFQLDVVTEEIPQTASENFDDQICHLFIDKIVQDALEKNSKANSSDQFDQSKYMENIKLDKENQFQLSSNYEAAKHQIFYIYLFI